ncbi:MAG: hypothetical protein KJ983_02660 [Candidatus Omnitrophica bacterium]|nr:hypothetical protein [Candidatus Omnitrophota bacterium]
MFNAMYAHAGASVSVTGGTWALGAKGAQSETASPANQWTVTGSSDGTEDVLIRVTEGTSTWTARTTDDNNNATANEFVLRENDSAGTLIKGIDVILKSELAVDGTYAFGLWFKAPPSGSSEGEKTLTVTLTATGWVPPWACGVDLTVAHTAGDTAPVDKTVTYGTVESSLTGSAKCWITQNLGASQQATAWNDSTEPSAGWYWQFNRKAGWKYDSSLYRASAPTSWDSTNDNTYTGWDPAKDPCMLLLGAGWRLPTNTEWTNADNTGGWTDADNVTTGTYASVLKLHATGDLLSGSGALDYRGSNGYYWSSTQGSTTVGCFLAFGSSDSGMYDFGSKACGFSVRCLSD